MRFAFPFIIVPRPEGGFMVTFPDFSEVTAQAQTEQAALAAAENALVAVLSTYVDEGRCLPSPSALAGHRIAFLPSLVAAKLALHGTMLAAGVSNVTLGRQLGMDTNAMRRLRDPLRRSHIEAVETALRALGHRLIVDVAQVARSARL